MELAQWCSSSRVIIVAGKGGVGKTTVAAALAVAAAGAGARALVVELDGKSGLAAMFGHPAITTRTDIEPGLSVLPLAADEALVEYLEAHGLGRISRKLRLSGALEIIATAVPGIREILVLGKVKALQNQGAADVIIVDGPAAGHAVTFLRSPRGLLDAVRVGPVLTQAVEVNEMLTDPDRSAVLFVTAPEETPVNETVETATAMREQLGLAFGPLVVNGLYPGRDLPAEGVAGLAARAGVRLAPGEADDLALAATFAVRRRSLQDAQLRRLADRLDLDQVPLPFLFGADIGRPELGLLAAALTAGMSAASRA